VELDGELGVRFGDGDGYCVGRGAVGQSDGDLVR
jgi:hypothetical protein